MNISHHLLDLLNPLEFYLVCYLTRESKNTFVHTDFDQLHEKCGHTIPIISRALDRLIRLEMVKYMGISGEEGIKIKILSSKVKPPTEKPSTFIPPTIEQVIEYCDLIRKRDGYDLNPKKIYNYYNDSNWVDSRKNQVKNWKTKILNNWCKEENKISGNNVKDRTYNTFQLNK